jgi:6-phosphogluconolactonase
MPVKEPDLRRAAQEYAATLRAVAGDPPVRDLVHLGLGPDGHTASLVPGDAVLGVHSADVAPTAGTYQGRRRLTLTYPTIDRARQVLWVVTGAEKVDALRKLRAANPSIPGGRVRQERAVLLADRDAAGES